ncbi:MAG: tetratricopeptide repeat protein, partial [Acidobacteriales bacterium]|nr:tetratricopeptide repeat protein [Terriglobales bacterium]
VPADGEAGAEADEEPLNPRRYEAAREFQKGLAAFAESKFATSIKYFKKTIEIDAGLDEAYIQLAQAYWRERQPAEAQAVLEKAAILSPENPRTLALLGRAYRVQREWEKAVTNLHHALKLKEDLWITHFELSESFSGWGRADDAFPHAQRAHELNANEPSAHQLYYNLLIHRRDYPAALAELDEFLRLFPKHPLADRARQQRQALSSEIAKTARN